MHRYLRILSTSLVTAGVVVLLDVGLTLVWKEPLSTVYGSIQQGKAEDQLEDLQDRFPTDEDLRAADSANSIEERVGVLADRFADVVETGQGIGRIQIDAIDLDTVIVEDRHRLAPEGPGPLLAIGRPGYPKQGDGSAFPGQGETVGIAGHRTTYLAPFRKLDELEAGDELVLECPTPRSRTRLRRPRSSTRLTSRWSETWITNGWC